VRILGGKSQEENSGRRQAATTGLGADVSRWLLGASITLVQVDLLLK
jgi:hypothetical protein